MGAVGVAGSLKAQNHISSACRLVGVCVPNFELNTQTNQLRIISTDVHQSIEKKIGIK
jgi:hypothetical protein